MVLRAATQLYRLKRNEWLNPRALERLQWQKLKRVLRYAYDNVPYYQRLFKSAGIRPEDVKTHEDFSKIPITTKAQIQSLAPEEMMARSLDRSECIEFRTSGATGKPLSVYRTEKDREFIDVLWTRSFMGAGLRWKDKKIEMGTHPPVPPRRRYWFQSLGIMRREYITFRGSEEYLDEFLKKGDFDILAIYPSRFKLFMGRIKGEHRSGRGPRLVFSAAELLDRERRRQMEDYFQAPVFDFYGMVEFGAMAWECASHRGFHINADTVFLEIVRNGLLLKPGERGRIIATGLHPYAMPFIRYDTEDVGILGREGCPCGRALPLLEKLEGRCNDFISLPDGSLLPTRFTVLLRSLKGLRHYRIVQEKIDELIVYLVLEAKAPPDLVKRVKKEIKAQVGETMALRVQVVDEIPPDPSGKVRSVISYVPVAF